jgi:hypothetical protein
MTLSKEEKEAIKKYNFRLVVQNKEIPDLHTIIEMDGGDKLENVFLEDTLKEIAKGIIVGEKQFNQYVEQGTIIKDKDGEYALSDKHITER